MMNECAGWMNCRTGTQEGTTYNSYIIRGADKVALIDASHEKFRQLYLDTLKGEIDPSTIDYIIVSHTEPDHSGLVGAVLVPSHSHGTLCFNPNSPRATPPTPPGVVPSSHLEACDRRTCVRTPRWWAPRCVCSSSPTSYTSRSTSYWSRMRTRSTLAVRPDPDAPEHRQKFRNFGDRDVTSELGRAVS
jgi:hypothetical protein